MKTYHQFYTISLPYPSDKVQNTATFIKDDILEWMEPLFQDFFEYNKND